MSAWVRRGKIDLIKDHRAALTNHTPRDRFNVLLGACYIGEKITVPKNFTDLHNAWSLLIVKAHSV